MSIDDCNPSRMITFAPRRGAILMCDFDLAGVAPEMRKKRRVIVVSPRSYNGRTALLAAHGNEIAFGPGKCVVVPLSATKPRRLEPSHVAFDRMTYRSLTVPTWAVCELIDHVSHARLDRVHYKGSFLNEQVNDADMARIEVGLRHALGLKP